MARRRMYGSATSFMPMADMTRVGHAVLLQGILEGEAVHDRREHAHVVAGRPFHALGGRREAAEDVAATDDDGDLHPGVCAWCTWRAMNWHTCGSTP